MGHFSVSGAFSNSHRSNPTPQTMLDACIQNFFRVSTLYRVGKGRTAREFRKGCTVLRGNRELREKYEYCSTHRPRTFVQDCRTAISSCQHSLPSNHTILNAHPPPIFFFRNEGLSLINAQQKKKNEQRMKNKRRSRREEKVELLCH